VLCGRGVLVNVEGTRTIGTQRDRVWAALLDPAILSRSIPGCKSLVADGDRTYVLRIELGVGAVKGTYDGRVRLEDLDAPNAYTMHVEANGSAGFVNATAHIALDDAAAGTGLRYRADANVGGLVAGVGGRMLAGVAKAVIDQFFKNFEREVAA
jgi:uncharacterized protein